MMRARKLKQRGFSLMELGIVLSVAGIAATVIFFQLSEANHIRRAQTASNDLGRIITNIQRLYSSRPDGFPPTGTSWNNDDLLIRNNVFPATWINANTVTNPFGGTYRIDTQTWGGGSVAAIVLGGVPSKVCSQLGQIMSGILGMSVNFIGVKDPQVARSTLNVETLGIECSRNDTADMAFFFDLGN